MKTFKMKFTRTYVTYVDVVAENEIEAMDIFEDRSEDGTIYEMELEQMNIEYEDVTIISRREVSDETR